MRRTLSSTRELRMERIETTYHATWHLDKSVIGIPSLTPTRLTRPANRARRRNMCSTSMAGTRAWSGSVAGSSRLSTHPRLTFWDPVTPSAPTPDVRLFYGVKTSLFLPAQGNSWSSRRWYYVVHFLGSRPLFHSCGCTFQDSTIKDVVVREMSQPP